jgi:antitoxin (DNA-binding transcriptional repressor) of toxin-antitoxin stability system
MSSHLPHNSKATLERLIQIALGNTGQSHIVANFLLAWWNAEECGGFDITDVWGVDTAIAVDMLQVFGMVAGCHHLPGRHGFTASTSSRLCVHGGLFRQIGVNAGERRGQTAGRNAMIQNMEPLHISEGDLAKDVPSILKRVETGAEVIIERNAHPVAVIRPAEPVRRKISECIALMPAESTATIDPDFAKDVEAAIAAHREPLEPPAWD